ncbi:hypothetical protein G7Y89_g3683 [Cudoniella acicularis]|uniref:T6SS Phospholipase effector Tle1-like catalytic domain-containing protein n=1 Tax=Cudoniella acicularis TaxID=354080 RepID=A0A8H4W5Q2_9HELO|nr:hypothetical protein G7Y89_g3683 [Cudoniella acicularis]
MEEISSDKTSFSDDQSTTFPPSTQAINYLTTSESQGLYLQVMWMQHMAGKALGWILNSTNKNTVQDDWNVIVLASPAVCRLEEACAVAGDDPRIFVTDRFIPGPAANTMADIVVSHEGQGTVQTAIAAGSPIIGVGTQMEQQINPDPKKTKFNHGEGRKVQGAGVLLEECPSSSYAALCNAQVLGSKIQNLSAVGEHKVWDALLERINTGRKRLIEIVREARRVAFRSLTVFRREWFQREQQVVGVVAWSGGIDCEIDCESCVFPTSINTEGWTKGTVRVRPKKPIRRGKAQMRRLIHTRAQTFLHHQPLHHNSTCCQRRTRIKRASSIEHPVFDDGYTKPTLIPYVPTGTLQVPSNVTRIAHALKRKSDDGTPQIIYYNSGVGTSSSMMDVITGGALGKGISEKHIREVYSFIASNYTPGDEIVLIGFSRGAFTARSVAGMIDNIGLLTRIGMESFYAIFKDQENFKTPNYKDIFPTVPFPNKPSGSNMAREYKRRLEELELTRVYDPDDSKIRVHAVAALALDEHRRPFNAAVWERKTMEQTTPDLRQVWFPGSHGNCGGGYDDQEIANITLAWMMDQLASIGINFEEDFVNQMFQQNVEYYENPPPTTTSLFSRKPDKQWAIKPIYEKHKPA